MKKLTILYVGRDEGITETMNRLFNARKEWTGLTACSDGEALKICRDTEIDLVLLGNGITADEEGKLIADLKLIKPDIKIIQHYGGGSGLLYGEIMSVNF